MLYNHTVARLTYKALLGRRRALILLSLSALLLVVSAGVRLIGDADDRTSTEVLIGFALAAMTPLVGVIAGTGAIAPQIDDGLSGQAPWLPLPLDHLDDTRQPPPFPDEVPCEERVGGDQPPFLLAHRIAAQRRLAGRLRQRQPADL